MSLSTTTLIVLSLQINTFFLFTATTLASSPPHGFTVDLIHRHSSSSPSQLSKTHLRSSPYADTFFDTLSSEYLMKLQIGTPPFEIEAILDTGSDLLWTQCLPCLNCYNQYAPMFDPSKSSTFKYITCDTPDHSCPYKIDYVDKTYSKGTYATETVTIHSSSGQPFKMAETVIGCGHNNSGLTRTASGIVGLNWDSLSLISQMGEKYLGIFSYCLASKGTSKINFGSNAMVAGDGTVSTTMFMKSEKPGYYYLNLDAVSVGDTRVETFGTSFHALEGNTVIDSGTTYTYFPGRFCKQVHKAVENVVTADRVADPSNSNKLCYHSGTIEIFPVITMHFYGGADLVLDKYNMYVNGGRVFCVAIMCFADETKEAVFGNIAQKNVLVGYDTSSLIVSFKPNDCGVEQTYQESLFSMFL